LTVFNEKENITEFNTETITETITEIITEIILRHTSKFGSFYFLFILFYVTGN